MSVRKAKIEIDGKFHELDILEGTEGEVGVNISKLRAGLGVITYDNGFGNTGSCQSSITFLNGEKGILRYRGHPIEQLAEHSTFLETSYLLNHGELPSESELFKFEKCIKENGRIPTGIKRIIDSFPGDAHPMGVCASTTAALSGFYPKDLNVLNYTKEDKDRLLCQLIGQMSTIITHYYRKSLGKDPIDYNTRVDYCTNFLQMMFGANINSSIDPEIARALDILLILHADHEQNCSTATVRAVGSGQSNLFASISAGIGALWGPLHGGANQAVLQMLESIDKDGGGYKKALNRAKDKNDHFKLMGFGHRVYKNFDPRAKIIKKVCNTVLEKLGVNDPLLAIAKGLEAEALKDEYFVERKLYPNVDFYSGIIYRALGIPANMFTVMFILGRLPGWIAQWREMLESKESKITRPRQIYQGKKARDYISMDKRKY